MKNIRIEDISKRYFKFKYLNGWRTKTFNSNSKLWRYIIKTKPLDSYISLNNFLNPKETDKSENPIITKYRTCIDCDDTNKENCLKILSILKENDLKVDYILQTSKNSLQIVLNGFYDNKIKGLLKDVDYCPSTLFDNKRVIRLCHSIHHSNLKTRLLNENLNEFEGVDKKEINKEKKKHEFYFKFLRTRVDGIKKNDRSILFYKSKFLNLKRVYYLQKKFNLGTCYVLEYEKDEEIYSFLFVKAIQNSQLKKIQKSNYIIRTSKKRNGESILSPEPKLIKVIPSEAKGYYSLTHLSWLRNKFGIKEKYDIEIGNPYKEHIGRFYG